MELAARHLAFHGSIVLLIGLLCGAPYARAIKCNAAAQTVNSWRVAHASLPIGGTMMFAVAALLSSMAVASPVKWAIAVTLMISSYAFCFSLPLAAVVGHRGLGAGGPLPARLVYLGNVTGAFGSLAAAFLLVYASFVSL